MSCQDGRQEEQAEKPTSATAHNHEPCTHRIDISVRAEQRRVAPRARFPHCDSLGPFGKRFNDTAWLLQEFLLLRGLMASGLNMDKLMNGCMLCQEKHCVPRTGE